MIEITAEELTQTIQAVKQAIDDSDFGPVYVYGGTDQEPKKIVSPLGAQIFVATLQQVLSKMDTIRLVKNPPPSEIAED